MTSVIQSVGTAVMESGSSLGDSLRDSSASRSLEGLPEVKTGRRRTRSSKSGAGSVVQVLTPAEAATRAGSTESVLDKPVPEIPRNTTKTKRTITLDQSADDLVRMHAAEQRVTVSNLIQQLIYNHLV